MAIRKIAQLGEPVLRQVAAPIPEGELGSAWLLQLISDMAETMRDADGAGLAAPQVYEPHRLCMLEVNKARSSNARYPAFPEIPFQVLINPKITPLPNLSEEEVVTIYEGCLSVPNLRGRVSRPSRVRVQAINPHGEVLDEIWEGVTAAIVQHEVDHLDGTLFVDRADPQTLCFRREFERHVPQEQRCIVPPHGNASQTASDSSC